MKNYILSKNIRKLRAFKNLNQTQFAELIEVKRASIGAYEEGRAEPKLDTLIRITTYFKITLDNLIVTELTVNQIAKFDKAYNKANDIESSTLEREIKGLKKKVLTLEQKIDTIISLVTSNETTSL